MSMKDYEFWFVVGSQFLYGPEVLETVEDIDYQTVMNITVLLNTSGNHSHRGLTTFILRKLCLKKRIFRDYNILFLII